MLASELAGSLYFKGLIYGQAGTGKTVLACQFPGPIEFWDFDNKISSAVRYLPTIGQAEQLKQIDVYQFGAMALKDRIPAWEKRSQLIEQTLQAGKPLHFKTLVLDTLTMFSHFIMEDYVFRSQLGIKRVGNNYSQQDYGLFGNHMTRILTGLIALPANILVLGHAEEDKDENTGAMVRKPLITGRMIGPMLPAWFEEVYAARVMPDGKRVLQTQPGEGYVVRSQRALPKFANMNVAELLK